MLSLTESIALIALPTVVTNLWQAAVGGRFRYIARRHWPLIVPLMVTLYLTMGLIGQKGPNWASVVLGIVLCATSLTLTGSLLNSACSMARTPSCRRPPWPHLWQACGSASASGQGCRSSNSGLRCLPSWHSRASILC